MCLFPCLKKKENLKTNKHVQNTTTEIKKKIIPKQVDKVIDAPKKKIIPKQVDKVIALPKKNTIKPASIEVLKRKICFIEQNIDKQNVQFFNNKKNALMFKTAGNKRKSMNYILKMRTNKKMINKLNKYHVLLNDRVNKLEIMKIDMNNIKLMKETVNIL
jgi:hypothetical protein